MNAEEHEFVCGHCGAAAQVGRFCSACGAPRAPRDGQDHLQKPSDEEATAAAARAPAGPGPQRRLSAGSFKRIDFRRRRTKAAIGGLVAVAIVATGIVLRGPSETAQVEKALEYNSQFALTSTADEVSCTRRGEERGGVRYGCVAIDHRYDNTYEGEWLWKPQSGAITRISDGGEESSAPTSADEASEIVTRVGDARTASSGSTPDDLTAQCVEANEIKDASGAVIAEGSNTYVCRFLSPSLPVDDELAARWSWAEDGTVRMETVTGPDEFEEAAGSASLNEGDPPPGDPEPAPTAQDAEPEVPSETAFPPETSEASSPRDLALEAISKDIRPDPKQVYSTQSKVSPEWTLVTGFGAGGDAWAVWVNDGRVAGAATADFTLPEAPCDIRTAFSESSC